MQPPPPDFYDETNKRFWGPQHNINILDEWMRLKIHVLVILSIFGYGGELEHISLHSFMVMEARFYLRRSHAGQ